MTPNVGRAGGPGIGSRLRAARELGGISARELDGLVDVSLGYCSRIEAGLKDPSSMLSNRLADVLGLSLDWLIAGVGTSPKPRAVKAAVAVARKHLTRS